MFENSHTHTGVLTAVMSSALSFECVCVCGSTCGRSDEQSAGVMCDGLCGVTEGQSAHAYRMGGGGGLLWTVHSKSAASQHKKCPPCRTEVPAASYCPVSAFHHSDSYQWR